MAVKGEEVATSIESRVREEVERMVGELRSSIEDVRSLVDSQLKAALQSIQADVNSLSFLPHIQKSITEFEEASAAERPQPVAAPTGGDVTRLKRAIQNAEQGKSQVDVLNSLLEQCLEFGSRAALLILRGETFSGWKGAGFAAHGGSDEMIKRFNAAPGLIPELDEVLRKEHVVEWDGVNLSTRFGVPASARAVLVPMVIKDKVSAAVYVDATTDDLSKLDVASIQLLVFMTGLLVDTLAIRKKSPSPSLAGGGDTPAAGLPQPASPVAAPIPPAMPSGDATVAVSAAQMREMMAGSAAAATQAPRQAPPSPPPPPPAAAPPKAPEAEPAAASGFGAEDRPSTQYVPPAGVAPRSAAGGPQGEDAKKHDEARRFARLLVSEIKLYNESKVEQGRKNKDLYERLKEDIDRSRQMYDERIPDEVRKQSNYFYDELVRILADGQADTLGL
jgi:hypothetical protein